ncbi:MAG TPA: MarR family transcriptional regulator [Acidimicrobiales bacterium]
MADGNPRSTGPKEAPPSVAFAVSRLGFEVSRALAEGLKPLGLDPQHFGLLRALGFSEGESQRAIGDSLSIPPNRMVALVDDLEALGAVKRAKHPTDRRAYAIFLTPKGRKLFENAFEVARTVEERLCANISTSDKKQLLDLLGHLNSLSGAPGGVHPGLSR